MRHLKAQQLLLLVTFAGYLDEDRAWVCINYTIGDNDGGMARWALLNSEPALKKMIGINLKICRVIHE